MLTDIFAARYSERQIWNSFGEADRALLIQCYRIVAEQVMPYWRDGKEFQPHKELWKTVESRLSMELGLTELSPHVYGFHNTQKNWVSGILSMDSVCKSWVLAEFPSGSNPDRFMKDRVSFVELAFRESQRSLSVREHAYGLVAKQYDTAKSAEAQRNTFRQLRSSFNESSDELNERFRRAKVPLSYHNGFIQLTTDEKLEEQVVRPFWVAVSDKKWENVSIDMAEAVDRRDTGGRDPAFYAAKALESAIKIILADKNWIRGDEKGAANYIDNLVTQRNGSRFIDVWEKDLLCALFGKVRNPLGHGPGGEPMPSLTKEQTNWAIESSMSWCKSLIERL